MTVQPTRCLLRGSGDRFASVERLCSSAEDKRVLKMPSTLPGESEGCVQESTTLAWPASPRLQADAAPESGGR
jgi:hypothetical protein